MRRATTAPSPDSIEPAQGWLLAALRGESPAWPAAAAREEGFFAGELLRLAQQQGVAALLHHRLYRSTAWAALPSAFSEPLQHQSRQAAAGELLRQHEVMRVLERLQQHGIQPLLLKGTALAYSLYPQPHLRTRCDSDLLFASREEAEGAWRVLAQLGYQRPNTISGELVSYQFSCTRRRNDGIGQALDLHWRINNQQHLAQVFDYHELRSAAHPLPQLSPHARTLSHPHALLLACVHRIAHQPEGMGNRLIWLYDIHLLMQQLDTRQWESLFQLARDKQLLSATLDGIRQTHHSFASPLPAGYHTLHPPPGECFTPSSARSRWRIEIANFRAAGTWQQRLRLLREHLFPSADYMLQKYHTRNRYLLPLLYLRRLIGRLRVGR